MEAHTEQGQVRAAEQGNADLLPTIDAAQFADGQGEPERYGWSKRLAAIVFLALTAMFVVSVIHDPGDRDPYGSYSTICMFKNATGVPCPGCGLTHSFCEIGKGRMASAFEWNWLGIPVFVFAILVWLKSVFVLGGWSQPALALDRLAARVRVLRLFAYAFVIYGVGRIIYILFILPKTRSPIPTSQLLVLFSGS